MDTGDRNRVLSKLDEMETYLNELKGILPNEKEYLGNLVKRRACEKTIELAIETMIDTAAIIVSSERFGLPTDEENIMDILVRRKVITPDIGERIKDMKGFRNILVHKYGRIDDKLVYEFLTNNLNDLDEFRNQINEYLQK